MIIKHFVLFVFTETRLRDAFDDEDVVDVVDDCWKYGHEAAIANSPLFFDE